MGSRLPGHSDNVVGASVHQIVPSPQLDKLLFYMEAIGENVDVRTEHLVEILGVDLRNTFHLGPYVGRLNHLLQKRGKGQRLVPGVLAKTYRLVSFQTSL